MTSIVSKSYLFRFIVQRTFVDDLVRDYQIDPARADSLFAMVEDLEWLCSLLSSAPSYVSAGCGSKQSLSRRLRQLRVEGELVAQQAMRSRSLPVCGLMWTHRNANDLTLLANQAQYVAAARNDN